jgi:hypothetical protein
MRNDIREQYIALLLWLLLKVINTRQLLHIIESLNKGGAK